MPPLPTPPGSGGAACWFRPCVPCTVWAWRAVLALPAPLLSGWRLYVFGGLTATAAEYLYHWWGDCFLRVRFWDYTGVPGNLRGRVCLPFSLAWGLLMFPAVKLAAPAAAALALRVPPLLTWLCLMASPPMWCVPSAFWPSPTT